MSGATLADARVARRAAPARARSASAAHESTRTWALALAACAAAAAARAGLAPLADPDLPMHLAVGEWIVAHHAVPYVEPFAWTRAGAPWYAYSWLAQLALYLLLRALGPLGLHLLAALAGAAVTGAGALAGRALGLRAAPAALLGALSAAVALESTPFLRPQLVMHVLVPLAFACTAALADAAAREPREAHDANAPRLPLLAMHLAMLLALSAAAANTHITFPVMAAPLALLVARATPRRTVALAAAAVGAGWLCSPYGLVWPAVFRLNFAPNALVSAPSPVAELAPGFATAPLLGAALACLPLVAVLRARERVVYGALWLAGLLAFALAFKALGPWWWCALPTCAAALRALPSPPSARAERALAALLALAVAAPAVNAARLLPSLAPYEGRAAHRSLPTLRGFAAEPAARWLERNLRPRAEGRLLTAFNYGSYLRWRLPSLSESIDSRGVFPDSAALPDAPARRTAATLGPWRSADVAVVPTTFPVALVLDASPEWRRVGVAAPAPWAPDAPRAGLWVRRAWWAASARAAAAPAAPAAR